MKVLLSILFFLLMASHVVVISHSKWDEVQLVQDSGDDNDADGDEEKPELKEYLPHPVQTVLSIVAPKTTFPIRYIPLHASPVMENQTPPPDRA